jgi:hydrogenase maturation factor
VVVTANDIAVTGARPRWFLATVLVPPGTTGDGVRRVFAEIHDGLARVGAYLVGGHSEVTAAVTHPVVVGHMLGLAEEGRVVGSGGARPGDTVVQVGRAPVEGAAVLAWEAVARLQHLDPKAIGEAAAATDRPGLSVVEPALHSTRLGATAMHDPTEGGLAAGLHEVAQASSVRIRVVRDAVLWFEPGVAICRELGLDPWATLASGALFATFPAPQTDEALSALRAAGHEASLVGQVEAGAGVYDSHGDEIVRPKQDEVARLATSTVSSGRASPPEA